jgi:hypothetical protein
MMALVENTRTVSSIYLKVYIFFLFEILHKLTSRRTPGRGGCIAHLRVHIGNNHMTFRNSVFLMFGRTVHFCQSPKEQKSLKTKQREKERETNEGKCDYI